MKLTTIGLAALLPGLVCAQPPCPADSPGRPPYAVERLGGRLAWYKDNHSDRTLYFLNSDLTDLDLAGVGDALMCIPRLKKLDLSFTKVEGRTLSHLRALPDLTDVDVSNTLIHDAGLRELAVLPYLQDLRLNYTYLTEDGLRDFADRLGPRLTSLHLSNAVVIDARSNRIAVPCLLAILTRFTRLKELSLSGMQLGDNDLAFLASRFPNVHKLNLSNNELTNIGLRSLGKKSRLTHLNLSGNARVTDGGLSPIASLTSLIELNLSGAGHPSKGTDAVTNQGLAHLVPKGRRISNLQNLYISNTKTRFDDQALKMFPRLKILDVSKTGVSNAELAAIGKLVMTMEKPVYLRELYLAGTTVSDKGLEHLKYLRRLAGIDIDATKATEAGVVRLAVLAKEFQQSHPPLTSILDELAEPYAVPRRIHAEPR